MFTMRWREAACRAQGLSIACTRRSIGKLRKREITPCCYTHSGLPAPLSQESGFFHLTPVKLNHYLNNKRSIWTWDEWLLQELGLKTVPICKVSKSSSNVWIAPHTWVLAMGCPCVPDGHQQASPVDSLPTSLGIKAVPPGNACSLSLALRIHWWDQIRLRQWT